MSMNHNLKVPLPYMQCMKTTVYLVLYRENTLTLDNIYTSGSIFDWILFCSMLAVLVIGLFISASLVIFGRRALSYDEYGIVSSQTTRVLAKVEVGNCKKLQHRLYLRNSARQPWNSDSESNTCSNEYSERSVFVVFGVIAQFVNTVDRLAATSSKNGKYCCLKSYGACFLG